MELLNLLCTSDPDTLRDLTMIYSTSTVARRNTSQLYENDILDYHDIKIDEDATSRVAEMFHVYLKNMGYQLKFGKRKKKKEKPC